MEILKKLEKNILNTFILIRLEYKIFHKYWLAKYIYFVEMARSAGFEPATLCLEGMSACIKT